ncbi:MAG: DNA polymerase III subunit gamma/tau [Pseudomonadota bacterium]
MSYLVLARKWRPQTFADVVGQQHVLKALAHSLDNERLHHAYLFAGTRGVGKTTLARILAKALNCERGVSATPCGECGACHEIDEGRFVDLIEVDAASRTKVDDTREMLDNVQYAPTRGRFKVYLIDEVHMLSTHSFNALLKTLEEPPAHVKFLLATTDPQKLPVTVLSRCLQFNLKRLTPALISERLALIADAEGVSAEPASLALLARAAEGSLRDALSLMDQAIAFGGGALVEHDVAQMLGALDRGQVVAIAEALAGADGEQLMRLIASADEQFPDYRRLIDELAQLLSRIAVYQATESTDLDDDEAGEIERLASLLSPADVQLYYQIALQGKRDMPLAPDPRVGMEMALLRMLAFRPASAAGSQQGGGSSVASTSRDGRDNTPKTSRTQSRAATLQHQSAKAPSSATTGSEAQRKDEAAVVDTPLSDWHRLIGQLKLGGVARLLAANCAFVEQQGETIVLSLDKRSESLLTEARIKELGKALSAHLDQDIQLRIEIDGATVNETPVQREAREQTEKQASVRDALIADPGVAEMRKLFDAELDEQAVRVVGHEAVDTSSTDDVTKH